jgi:chemotaxis protein MotB
MIFNLPPHAQRSISMSYTRFNKRKIVRVVGLASSVQLNKEYPRDPTNRRISIVVLNRKAELALKRDGNTQEMSEASDLQGLATGSEPATAAAHHK